jgi:hypothetical protein
VTKKTGNTSAENLYGRADFPLSSLPWLLWLLHDNLTKRYAEEKPKRFKSNNTYYWDYPVTVPSQEHVNALAKALGISTDVLVIHRKGLNPYTHTSSYGQALSIQAVGQICKKWTGTAHVHRLRNTFVMGMLESGASLREIQGKLLHSSMATTSGYVDKLTSAKNAHAGDLSKLFNIK